MAEGGTTLEYTPTWVVAVVCSVIVFISLAVERILHFIGKYLKKKNQKPLFEALQKIKAELMLLGFISLLLTVFQDRIAKICIPKDLANQWLPCQEKKEQTVKHIQTLFFSFLPHATGRHLLAEASGTASYCTAKGKVPLLSTTALHHLHIFIFVLAVVHVTFCALTILFGSTKIHQWKSWEDYAKNIEYDPEGVVRTKITQVQEHDFIRNRFLGIGKNSELLGWVYSFFKQFYGSVTKSDYITLRLGFIMTHCRGNPKFNFHNYMMRALEADFKKFQYGFKSCMMGQMGSSYKKAIFEEHIREGLVGWARKAKKNAKGNAFKRSANGSSQVGPKEESPLVLEMVEAYGKESAA
ncbi:Mlo-related protein - like 10 [Theobroma cacao]|nr:Mlo-related protein - like 10 [Theobroma cacao]